jgi:hypothetical protein
MALPYFFYVTYRNVTLLIIEQRPSQIYDEVMSQLGTRISGWLGDDADISAVLSGLAGRDSLRSLLARLQLGDLLLRYDKIERDILREHKHNPPKTRKPHEQITDEV